MSPFLATIIYATGIAGLFYLDRDKTSRVSRGLWVAVLWVLIIGSRPVSGWLQQETTVSQQQTYQEGSPIDAAVYGCIIVAGVLVLSRRRQKVGEYVRANLPIILFLAYCALSIAWSGYSFIAFKRWIKSVGDVVMVVIILTDPDVENAIRRVFSRASFLLLPLSLLFIKYYPEWGRAYNPWTGEPMYSGVTTFKNLLGMTCLICGMGSLWSFMRALHDRELEGRMRHLIAHGSMVALALSLIVTANSMTSLSCYLMSGVLLIMAMRSHPSSRLKTLKIMMVGFIVLSLFSMFVDPEAMLKSIGRDPTFTGRREIWAAVLSMHSNPLVGTGFESFWMGNRLTEMWRLTAKGIQEAHNGYLEVYINLGFVGLAFLAVLIVAGYRNSIAHLRNDRVLGAFKLAFITAGLIYSLSEAGFRMMSSIWVCFLIAVSCIPVEILRQEASQPVLQIGWWQSDVPVDTSRALLDDVREEHETRAAAFAPLEEQTGSNSHSRIWDLKS